METPALGSDQGQLGEGHGADEEDLHQPVQLIEEGEFAIVFVCILGLILLVIDHTISSLNLKSILQELRHSFLCLC